MNIIEHQKNMEACEGKQHYESEARARSVMRNCQRTRKAKLRAYKCPICHKWLITSSPSDNRKSTGYKREKRVNFRQEQ